MTIFTVYLLIGLCLAAWITYQRWYYVTANRSFVYLLLMALGLVVIAVTWPAFALDVSIKSYKLAKLRVSK